MDQGEIIWIQRENSGCKVSNLIEDLEQKLQMMMMMTLSRACTKIIKYFLFSEIEGPSGEFSFHRSPIGLLVNRGGLERPTN